MPRQKKSTKSRLANFIQCPPAPFDPPVPEEAILLSSNEEDDPNTPATAFGASDASTPTFRDTDLDSSNYDSEEEGNGDEVDIFDEEDWQTFWNRLCAGLKDFEAKLRLKPRPTRYDKMNPSDRTMRRKAQQDGEAKQELWKSGFPSLLQWFKPGAASRKRAAPPERPEKSRAHPKRKRLVSEDGQWEIQIIKDVVILEPGAAVEDEPSGSTASDDMDGESPVGDFESISDAGDRTRHPSEVGTDAERECDDYREPSVVRQEEHAGLVATSNSTIPGAELNTSNTRETVLDHITKLEKLTKQLDIDIWFRGRITAMLGALRFYANGAGWTDASLSAATAAGRGPWLAHKIRQWLLDYIENEDDLPINRYGQWNVSRIEDEDLSAEIQLHLQSKGSFFKAQDIVDYMAQDSIKNKYGLTNGISKTTAQQWLNSMDYRFGVGKKGMYIDGHEREDVVRYRQEVFIPLWIDLERRMFICDRDGNTIGVPILGLGECRVILVTHDESTFYANDRRKTRWISITAKPTPMKKGEGISLMVSDFSTPEAGWLRSADGKDSARIIFKAGKNRDGWFGHEDLHAQVDKAITIFEDKFGAGIVAAFGFDNAPSHQKRAPDALSAQHMPLKPKIWNGKSGVRMCDGKFENGNPQAFYFPDDHLERPRQFKGMKIILEERGLWPTDRKFLAQCKDFKCPKGSTDCCARHMLFNQPDFTNQEPVIVEFVRSRGHLAFLYPKYHCKINYIEQVWGEAKYKYREFPPTSVEAQMEKYVIEALDSVDAIHHRRFSIRSSRFVDAYRKGLNGSQAAWATRKYHGHRTLPLSILNELDSI